MKVLFHPHPKRIRQNARRLLKNVASHNRFRPKLSCPPIVKKRKGKSLKTP